LKGTAAKGGFKRAKRKKKTRNSTVCLLFFGLLIARENYSSRVPDGSFYFKRVGFLIIKVRNNFTRISISTSYADNALIISDENKDFHTN
jgi:hypothetical protein